MQQPNCQQRSGHLQLVRPTAGYTGRRLSLGVDGRGRMSGRAGRFLSGIRWRRRCSRWSRIWLRNANPVVAGERRVADLTSVFK